MPQYTSLYLNKKSSEYAKILNVSDAVHSIRSLYKLLSRSRQTYSEHCQKFKIERFTKTVMAECRHTTRKFSGQGRTRGTRTLREILSKTRKKGSAGKYFVFFLLDTLKTTFQMENLTQTWTQSGLFFQKSGYFFRFWALNMPDQFTCSTRFLKMRRVLNVPGF